MSITTTLCKNVTIRSNLDTTLDVNGSIHFNNELTNGSTFTVSSTGVNMNSLTTNYLQIGTGTIGSDSGTISFIGSTGCTGCYISPIRNVAGNKTVQYNSITNEIGYITNRYVYAYSTGTQIPTLSPEYTPILFEVNDILSNFEHAPGSSMFTGTVVNTAYFNISYSLNVHGNTNSAKTLGVYIELDGAPIPGSFRTSSVTDNNLEYCVSNNMITLLTPGSHSIRLMMSCDSLTNPPTIDISTSVIPPGESGSSASLTITRVA